MSDNNVKENTFRLELMNQSLIDMNNNIASMKDELFELKMTERDLINLLKKVDQMHKKIEELEHQQSKMIGGIIVLTPVVAFITSLLQKYLQIGI